MYLNNTENAELDISVVHQVLRTYGGVEDTNSVISQVNATDLYAINQNLIWLIVNNMVNGRCSVIIDANPNLSAIYNAYVNGIDANVNYNPYTENNVSIDKSNAKVLENGVVGPFEIIGNGGIYCVNTSGKVNGNLVTTKLYKDSECNEQINQYDNYYGSAYIKLEGFQKNTRVSAEISLQHSYITEGRFWYTEGNVDPGEEAQPLLTFKRKTTQVKSVQEGEYDEQDIKVNVKKIDMSGKKLSGGKFHAYLGQKDMGTMSAYADKNLGTLKRNTNSNYIYISEEMAPTGYNNIIEGVLLCANVSVDANGKISVYNTYVCDTERKPLLNNGGLGEYFVNAEVENNTIVFTIKNPQEDNINVKVLKEDMNGKALSGGLFGISTNYTVEQQREAPIIENIPASDQIKYIYVQEINAPNGYINKIKGYVLRAEVIIDESGKVKVVGTAVCRKNNDGSYMPVADNISEYYEPASVEGEDTVVFKIKDPPETTEEGSYNIQLIKKSTNGSQLGDVKFTASAVINGESKTLNTESNPLTTSATKAVAVGSAVTIDKGKVEIADTYTLREYDIGNNKGHLIGIDKDIVLTVKKKSEKSSDGSKITNSVTGIELAIEGEKATNSGTSSSVTLSNGAKVTATLAGNTITITVNNPELTGDFDLDLIKYVEGTTIPLAGAEFKVSVKDGTRELADTNKTYKTGSNGHFTEKVSVIGIEAENKTYTVTVTETKAPIGYEGISGPITFNVTSKLGNDGKSYVLTAGTPTTATNAKKVTVTEGQVLIEVENTPEGPHKGVKEVNNQDSGYYDEVTGKIYKDKEELESTLHDWVITSRIPSGIDQYAKYIITDPIDERLVFSGIESVKVVLLDGETLEEKETLTSDKDYKVNYDEETRTLKVSFIEDDFKAGQELEVGSIVEIRFNTTFAKDEDGNIIAINQSVENKATLTYGDNSGNEVSKDTETPEVHTGGVGLYKYDKKTGKALEGAKFKIATSKENAENGIFVKDANGNDIEKVTNEKGIAVFEGLEFGEDAMDDVKYKTGETIYGQPVYKYDWEKVETTYYIVETEAPAGYSKIEGLIEAVVKKDNYDITDIETLIKVGNELNIFDLSLRKWVTQAIVTENGQTVVTETGHKAEDNPEGVVKVDLKKSKLNNVTVKFRYSIRITNEGEIAGEATEIRDDIPNGLKFVTEDNPDWREENGQIVTDKLANTTLQPGESAEVEILLTWINDAKNMGVMVNTAEINKDHNAYGTPDIDSTPGNNVPGEDDIDDAPVMITIRTGSEIIPYIGIALGFITVVAGGVITIKKSSLSMM